MKLFYQIRRIWHSFSRSHIPIYAAAICYYLFLSSIQSAWLFLYVISSLQLPPNSLERFFTLFVPETFYPVLEELLDAAKSRHPILVPFAVLTAIWSSSKTVSTLWDGLNCDSSNSLSGIGLKKRILASFYYIFLILILLAGFISSLLGKRLLRIIPNLLSFLEKPLVQYGWSFLLLCCFFTSIYFFLPNEFLSFRSCLIAGIAVASGWSILTITISLFYARLSRYYNLGLLVLFGLWLYNCMLLLLYGRLAAKMLDEVNC